MAASPWFHVTADLPVIQPKLGALDGAIVFGLRAKMDLQERFLRSG